MRVVQLLPADPERFRASGRRVVDDDFRGGDELGECRASGRGLQIEDDRPLPAVERHEETTDPRCYGHDPAVGVAIRRLDLDHLGAELDEE